jgi:hypothetical protein
VNCGDAVRVERYHWMWSALYWLLLSVAILVLMAMPFTFYFAMTDHEIDIYFIATVLK